MKSIYSLLIIYLIGITSGFSQCPDCIADENCGSGESFPTLCPEFLVNAVAGEYYEETITFYLPAEVQEGEITATLEEVVVLSVTGLPFGMELTINDEDLTFYPSQGDTFGCATLCGTPVLAGDYVISINAQVTVLAFGFEQVIDQGFSSPLEVMAGESSNNSFSLSSSAGCGELSLELISLIDGSPNPTEYLWDFDNGITSSMAVPEVQDYLSPGDYTVSLTTTIFQYELDQLVLNSISDNGNGDLDELFGALNPDPYIVVLDGNGSVIFTSSSIDDVESATFSDLNIILSLNFEEFVVQIWDSDTLTDDDLLGQFVISNSSAGSENFANEGSEGSYTINYEISSQFFDEELISVIPVPLVDLEYFDDTQTLSLPSEENSTYQWLLNEGAILDENMNSIVLVNGGVYQCEVTNQFGCSALSEEFVYCPEIIIEFDDNILSVESGLESYTWFYNGLEVMDENGYELPFQGDGNYAVEITTIYGCEVESEVISVVDSVTEIKFDLNFEVFPNPVVDILKIKPLSYKGELLLTIYSINGQKILSKSIRSNLSQPIELDLSSLPTGTYSVVMESSLGLIGSKIFMK